MKFLSGRPRRVRFLKAYIILFWSLGLALIIFTNPGAAKDQVMIYFFWSEGCNYCERQKPLLEDLQKRFPEVKVEDRNINESRENRDLLVEMREAYGKDIRGVPATFIGDEAWMGYTEDIGQEIEAKVQSCIEKGCTDPLTRVKEEANVPTSEEQSRQRTLNLPFVGSVDFSNMSVIGSTALIAFVDGFNPCSLWVLTFLLGILVHTRSRKQILLVGLTFLFVTATTYGLFILGLFSAFQYIGQLLWIRLVVALLAFTFGVVSVKDYFWLDRGISFTIPDSIKPKLGEKIRDVMNKTGSPLATLGGTALMALGVTLVELPCTAGFPVIWTGLMSGQDVGGYLFTVLFLLYILIYLLLELIIFAASAVTLRSSRLQETQGRFLKLIGGNLMLVLGGSFLFAPQVMYDMSGVGMVFGVALIATLLMIFVHKTLLPSSEINSRE
ncbi:MAG: hypothetical protein ACOC82_05055 [Candidatus Bipolaricaulota bacterium]